MRHFFSSSSYGILEIYIYYSATWLHIAIYFSSHLSHTTANLCCLNASNSFCIPFWVFSYFLCWCYFRTRNQIAPFACNKLYSFSCPLAVCLCLCLLSLTTAGTVRYGCKIIHKWRLISVLSSILCVSFCSYFIFVVTFCIIFYYIILEYSNALIDKL